MTKFNRKELNILETAGYEVVVAFDGDDFRKGR